MNINQFNAFVSTLKQLHDSDMQHTQHSKYSESIYSTVFNDLNVDIIYKKLDTLLLSICNIQFKTNNNDELFKVHFLSDTTNNHATYGYQSISIDNIVVRDSKLTDTLLKSVKFDEFIENNYSILEKEIAAKKNIEQSEKSKFSIDKLLAHCSSQNKPLHTDYLFANARGIQNSQSNEYLFEEITDPEHHLKIKTHSAFINSLHVQHQIVPSTRGHGFHHTLLCSDKDIHFSLLMIPKLSKYSTDFYQIEVGNDIVKDHAIINHVIQSFGIDHYLDKTLQQIKVYEKVEQVEREITEVIREAVTKNKAQAVIQLLTGQDMEQPPAMENPATIRNATVWMNAHHQLHRDDGPAIENYQGLDLWFKNGKAYIPDKSLSTLYNQVIALSEENNSQPEVDPINFSDKKQTRFLVEGMKQKFAYNGSQQKHGI